MKRFLYAGLVILALFAVEQVFEFTYLVKTLIKLPLFTVVPMLALRNASYKKGKFPRQAILVSLGVFLIIIATYMLLGQFIDVHAIQSDFVNRMQISSHQYILIGLYTIFVNAFIEELFFRSYLLNGRRENVILASLFFAIYHIAIFATWFSIPMFLLAMLGLFVGGLIFSYFTLKHQSFISSYLIHMAADLAIVLIGYNMLVA